MLDLNKIKERFESKILPEPNSGCWLWNGSYFDDGYGQFYFGVVGGKEVTKKASRVSWEIHRGVIPDGLHVLHKCDTPACVNPDHLFLGTHQDNMDDRGNKGRTSRGDKRYNFKRSSHLLQKAVGLYESNKSILEICEALEISKTTYYRLRGMAGFPKENYRRHSRFGT